MKKNLLLVILLVTGFQAFSQKEKLAKTSAGFPVNYDEDAVGAYTLPDLFILGNGQKISTSKEWTEKRRPELLRLIEETEYGKMPGPPPELHFSVFEKGTPIMDGKAIRKQVTVYFTKDESGSLIALL